MAFYQNAPEQHKRKTNYAQTGSWDEEGSHYRRGGQGERRETRNDERRNGFRGGERGFAGAKPGMDRKEYGREQRGSRNGFDKPGFGRSEGRPSYGKPGFDKPGFGRSEGRPGFSKPGFDKPGFGHSEGRSGYGKPGFDKPGFGHGEGRPGFSKPGFDKPGFGHGEGRPGFSKPGFDKPGFGHGEGRPSYGKPGFDKPGFGHGEGRPGFSKPSFRRPEDAEPRPFPRPPVEERPKDYRDFEYHAPVQAVLEVAEEKQDENYILCGRNPIREALKSGRDLEKLLVQKGELSGSAREIVQMAKESKVLVQEVEKIRLDEIAPHHQGLIAFASAYAYATVEEMLQLAKDRGEAPFLILLDGVTDPHNLGAIIRTAECCGAHGVIVPQHRSVGLTPSAVKAAAGALEHLKVARVMNLNRTLDELKQQGIWTYAVTMDGQDYEKVGFEGGTALVIGAEGEGISRLTAEKCDQAVSLPMKGHLDSLNASVAAGVMMYRVLSSRRK